MCTSFPLGPVKGDSFLFSVFLLGSVIDNSSCNGRQVVLGEATLLPLPPLLLSFIIFTWAVESTSFQPVELKTPNFKARDLFSNELLLGEKGQFYAGTGRGVLGFCCSFTSVLHH